MASDKRERQRVNRGIKQAEEDKADKKSKRIAIIKRYAMYAAIFGAAIVALKLYSG
jgi:hypothetical protein